MEQYLALVEKVLKEGKYKENRTGVGTISDFGGFHKVDLRRGFPLLTTKSLSDKRWNSLVHELLWFIRGEPNIAYLKEKEVHIWDAWAKENGDIGPVYGVQWRNYEGVDYNTKKLVKIDQLKWAIELLKKDPDSRRCVVTAWNPAQISAMGLPPCHHTFTLNILDGALNLHMEQRSCDIALGVPFNIASYALLTHLVARDIGVEAGEFAHTLVDMHAYCGTKDRAEYYKKNLSQIRERMQKAKDKTGFIEVKEQLVRELPEEEIIGQDHIPGLLEQLSRTPRRLPTLNIAEKSLEEITFNDIHLLNYNPYPPIKFVVAV